MKFANAMTTESNDDQTFNPALRDWLNARDYCSGDWPYNVPRDVMMLGDVTFGGGQILDEDGWPIPGAADYAFNYPHDPIYLGA